MLSLVGLGDLGEDFSPLRLPDFGKFLVGRAALGLNEIGGFNDADLGVGGRLLSRDTDLDLDFDFRRFFLLGDTSKGWGRFFC